MAEILGLSHQTVHQSPIEMFWTIMTPKSATLNLCRDVDESVLVLQEVCADLARWKSEVLEEKHLPLNQFARLNTISAKLSRSKIDISLGVTDLLDQVRSMLLGFDAKSSRQLEMEMELVRNDKLLFLEDKIEKLTLNLSDSKQSSKAKTTRLAWKHLVLQVFDMMDADRADKNQKLLFEFVNSLKHRDRKDTAKLINKQIIKSNMKKLVKSQIPTVENHELDMQKREEKLFVTAKQKSKQELNDWLKENNMELQSIAQERLALQMQQLQFETSKQEFEENRNKREIRLQQFSQELEERESLVNARFPELSEIETYITDLLKKLDSSAKSVLQSVATPDQIQTLTDTALKSIAFAEQELISQGLKSKQTLKHSMPHVTSTIDSGVQCNLIFASTLTPYETAQDRAQDHKGTLVLRRDEVHETALTGHGSLREGPPPPHHPAPPFPLAVEPRARDPNNLSHMDKIPRGEAGLYASYHAASASLRSTENADKNGLGRSMRQDSVKDYLSQELKTASRAHNNGDDLGGTSEAIKHMAWIQTQDSGEHAFKSDNYEEDKDSDKEVSPSVMISQMDKINQTLQFYCSMSMEAQDKTEKIISTLLQLQAEMKGKIQQIARVKEECNQLELKFALMKAAVIENSDLFHQSNATSLSSRSIRLPSVELISKSNAALEPMHDQDLVAFDFHCQDMPVQENLYTGQPTSHGQLNVNLQKVHMSKTGTVVLPQSPVGESGNISDAGQDRSSVHDPRPLITNDELYGLHDKASAQNSPVHPSILNFGPKAPVLFDEPSMFRTETVHAKFMNEGMPTDALHNIDTGHSVEAFSISRSIQHSKEVATFFEQGVLDKSFQASEVNNTTEDSRGKINFLEATVQQTDHSAEPRTRPHLPSNGNRQGTSHKFKPEESQKLRINGAVEKVLTQFDGNILLAPKVSGDKDGLRRYIGPANHFRKQNSMDVNDKMAQNRQLQKEHVGGQSNDIPCPIPRIQGHSDNVGCQLSIIEAQEENLNQNVAVEPTDNCNFQGHGVEDAGQNSRSKKGLGTAEYDAKIKELEERERILMIREKAVASMVDKSRDSLLLQEKGTGILHDVSGGGWALINQEEFARPGPVEKTKETTEIIRFPASHCSQQDIVVTPKRDAGRAKQREEIYPNFSETTSCTVAPPLGTRADHLKNSAKRTSISGSIHKAGGTTRKESLGLAAQELNTGVMESSNSAEEMLSNLKNLDIKHLMQLQDLFRSKIAMLESEFSQRIAQDRSFRPHDDREPCLQTSQIDTFISTVLSSEDNIADHIPDNTTPKATKFPQIQPIKNARPLAANMAALPAIYLPSMSRFQAKGIPRRVGGGFTSSAGANGEPLRYSSAPTGLVEYLTMQGNPVDL